jgi:hypothetical protein
MLFDIMPQKQVFCGTLSRNYARIFILRNQAPLRKGFSVRFSVRPLPKPEPDPFEPELMVQFRVQENPQTEPVVWFGVQEK